jgi:hypothetical protein
LGRKRHTGQKKLRTREHVIADLSVNHVEKCILFCGYSVERIQHDYGVDLLMFTYAESGEIESGEVRFQIKATDKLTVINDGATVALRVSVADVRNWMDELMPVILVAYDAAKDNAFWIYVQRELEKNNQSQLSRLMEDHEQGRETTTIHVPKANRLDAGAIREFRQFRAEIVDQARMKGVIRHDV